MKTNPTPDLPTGSTPLHQRLQQQESLFLANVEMPNRNGFKPAGR